MLEDSKGYIELSNLKSDVLEDKRKILEVCQGNTCEYLELCKVCGGFGL